MTANVGYFDTIRAPGTAGGLADALCQLPSWFTILFEAMVMIKRLDGREPRRGSAKLSGGAAGRVAGPLA